MSSKWRRRRHLSGAKRPRHPPPKALAPYGDPQCVVFQRNTNEA